MLNARKNEVLRLIVEDYIKEARPVGSNIINEILGCSSATIRNEMAELEELGFLEKTHTSSGRIPSEKGYRYYVDNLMKPKNMTGEEMLKLQTIFHNQSLEISDVIKKSVEIIAEMTNYTSIILGSASKENKLKQVQVVPLEEYKFITILVTDKGHVEYKQLETPNVSLDEIKTTVELINDLLIGTPIDQVGSKLEFEIKPIIGKYVKQHEVLYNAFYNAFNDFSTKSSIHFLGKSNFLKQPEFNNVDKLREAMDKLEDKELIRYITEDDNDIKVYIGSENKVDEDMTIIKTKYTLGSEEGTIAIIGPTRMEYDRVLSLLKYIKGNIGR